MQLFLSLVYLLMTRVCASVLESACNLEPHHLLKRCKVNELQINTPKSVVVPITSKLNSLKVDLSIYYNVSPITCQKSIKYLGYILIPSCFSIPTLNKLKKKLRRLLVSYVNYTYFFPKLTLLLLYYALTDPPILCALLLWGCAFPSYLKKLQRLQYNVIGIISNNN